MILNLLFGLSGRLNRKRWWLYSIAGYIVMLGIRELAKQALLAMVPTKPQFPAEVCATNPDLCMAKLDAYTQAYINSGPWFSTIALASQAAMLLLAWVQFALDTKRMHDFNYPMILPIVARLPLVIGLGLAMNPFLESYYFDNGAVQWLQGMVPVVSAVLTLGGYAIYAGFSLLIGLVPGDADENMYGPGDSSPVPSYVTGLEHLRPSENGTAESSTHAFGKRTSPA